MLAELIAFQELLASETCELAVPLSGESGDTEATLLLRGGAATIVQLGSHSTVWVLDAQVTEDGGGFFAQVPGPVVLTYFKGKCDGGEIWQSEEATMFPSTFWCVPVEEISSRAVDEFGASTVGVLSKFSDGRLSPHISFFAKDGAFLGIYSSRWGDREPAEIFWKAPDGGVSFDLIVSIIERGCGGEIR